MIAIQQELNPAYHDPIHLRENIIRTCRNHSALINDLNNASLNVLDLINSLHTSVMNYEAIRKSNQQIDYLQQSNQKSDNQYFIDRQYRRDEEFSYDRRDDYRRDEFRDRSNDRFQSNRRLKRCFVCNKLEC